MLRSHWKQLIFLAVITAGPALLLGGLLVDDPLLDRDDRQMVEPLREIHSVAAYRSAVLSGAVLDLQPLRDLTIAANLQIEQRTGYGGFHLTNLVLWIIAVLVVWRLLRHVGATEHTAMLVAGVLALHPSLLTSCMWVSARKHLLAAVFTLLATLILLRHLRRPGPGRAYLAGAGVVICFAAAVLSQPITILWPAWGVLACWLWRGDGEASLGRRLVPVWGTLPVAAAGAVANYLYYTSGPYLLRSGTEKLAPLSFDSLGVSMLALGRDFFQLVFPFRLAVDYYPGSPVNVVGAVLLIGAVTICLKLLPWREAVLWLGLAAFPLALVTLRMTNIFVADTYLLVPGAGVAILAALLAGRLGARLPRARAIGASVALAIALAYAVQADGWARAWSTDTELYAYSYESEPTPRTTLIRSWDLLEAGRHDEALVLAQRLAIWDPGHPGLTRVLGLAVHRHPTLPPGERLAQLELPGLDPAWAAFFRGAVIAGAGRAAEGLAAAERGLASPGAFGAQLPEVAADVAFLCRAAGRDGCAQIADRCRRDAPPGAWHEGRFRRRLAGNVARGGLAL